MTTPEAQETRAQAVYTISEMMIECMGLLNEAHEKNLNVTSDEILVMCAIRVGQGKKKPMNATMISKCLNIPRTSVLRTLANLLDDGLVQLVGKAYLTVGERDVPVLHEKTNCKLRTSVMRASRSIAELNGAKLPKTDVSSKK